MQNAILDSLKLVQLEAPSEPARSEITDAAALQKELERQIQGEVRFDTITRALYSTDASVYMIRPLGVVIPKNREDVIRIVQICGRMRCPLTMRGGGTSQAGQAIGEGLQVDTSKYFNRVLEVNAEERWARVEPGVVLDELNAQLAPLGLRFAPDISTASRATIGGMMANNSAGARSVLYGKTIDHVLEQTVVLADGSIAEFREIPRDDVPQGDANMEARCYQTVLRLAAEHADEIDRRYPKVLRRVGGYNLNEFVDRAKPVNLAKMLVGSEGTLGVVLEAKLRLVPLPKAKAVMVIEFADLLEALSAAPVIVSHGPSAVEVMDKSILDNTRQNANLDRIRASFIEGDPAATLCVEFYGDKKEDLPPRLAALEQDLRERKLGYRYHCDTDPISQARIWSLREAALGLSMAMKEDAKSISFVEDTAVAPEKLSEYIGRFLQIVHDHGTTAGVYAHASVGCLHVRPVVNMKTEEGVAKFESLAKAVANLVLEFGGALSGEHGDGLVRGPFMRQMFGDTLYEAFREIKQTFDPHGIFNPGKIVDSPPLTSNLRFGAGYQTPKPVTFFDYSDFGGFGGAVEMCSGVGACRKKLSGTMCPSYMATRDEKDSTRGRANTLRLAMAGRLGESGLGDLGVYDVLDLCLECRACKAECPVGVDVARFKSEFLADYWSRHGTPLRARALGGIADASIWGSRFAPASNWVARAVSGIIGIDPRRKLPAWKRQTFSRWRAGRSNAASAQQVTLFNDTFTNHYDPEIGIAAVEVLERGGCSVDVVRPGCCGRPLISQGLLEGARAQAAKLVDGLWPIANGGGKILFLEPSCLSSVKEDVPSLLRGERQTRARAVAGACVLFEEFASGLNLQLRSGPQRVLLHGHCHQKSMGLLDASKSLLAKIPGATVVDLDAGCCGMAGSFGYTREHYDVSVAIANRKLLPAVKAMRPGDVLAAPGTSCRHQVADLSSAEARHPAVLIRDLLQ
ncbi:MAG TPA: FAD-linked oxidase C-terminal domain-containing protein [Bryobacteraceae bacterium]|jgi:FAD/FMN-containing dehydrogenase/Fe-S oxidoreductase|nr:FAD-linked oxidase C-terminal domain-containing protein [Bryobacteraceae bacterium]